MRKLLTLVCCSVAFMGLSACGYRTPLSLPKPQAKPPATVPTPTPTQSETK